MSNHEKAILRWRHTLLDKETVTRTEIIGLLSLAATYGDDPTYLSLVADASRAVFISPDCDYVSDENADWLTAYLGDGDGLKSRAEFEVLRAIADHAPSSLLSFTIREMTRAIATGQRAIIGGEEGGGCGVTARDVALLQSLCDAGREKKGEKNPRRIDRAVAAALLDLAQVTSNSDNDPAFEDFCVQALRHYLDCAKSSPTSEALSPPCQAWTVNSIFSNDIIGSYGTDSYQENETPYILGPSLVQDPVHWVFSRLRQEDQLSPVEKRLLACLQETTPPLTEAA